MHYPHSLSMRAPGDAGGARAGVTKNASCQNFRFLRKIEMHAATAFACKSVYSMYLYAYSRYSVHGTVLYHSFLLFHFLINRHAMAFRFTRGRPDLYLVTTPGPSTHAGPYLPCYHSKRCATCGGERLPLRGQNVALMAPSRPHAPEQ